jgi:long-chain acyl-CoA synthetase
VAAVVLATPGAVDEATLLEWVNERVDARYQRLRSLRFLEDLPRNVAGKTLKRVLRERFESAGEG